MKLSRNVIIIGAIVVLLLAAVLGVVLYRKSHKTKTENYDPDAVCSNVKLIQNDQRLVLNQDGTWTPNKGNLVVCANTSAAGLKPVMSPNHKPLMADAVNLNIGANNVIVQNFREGVPSAQQNPNDSTQQVALNVNVTTDNKNQLTIMYKGMQLFLGVSSDGTTCVASTFPTNVLLG